MKNKTQCFLVVTQHSQNFAQTSSMAVCVFTSQSYVLPNTDLLAYGTFLRIVSQYWFLASECYKKPNDNYFVIFPSCLLKI